MEKLKSNIKKLKILLIILTIIEIGYLFIVFFYPQLSNEIIPQLNLGYIIKGLHFVVVIFFIWFIWKKMPTEKSKKDEQTLMIIFLGIIGMWLWLPNKKELDKIAQKQSIQKQ